MPRYKLETSRKFIEKGVIDPVDNIDWMLKKCKNHQEQIYLLLLFLTGARPSEILLLNTDNVYRNGSHLVIYYKTTLKNGVARMLYRRLKGTGTYVEYAQLLLELINSYYVDGQQLFNPIKWNLEHCKYVMRKVSSVNGKPMYNSYFFRHHHHSTLSMNGASIQEVKYNKGSRTIASAEPYVHVSSKEQEKIGNYLVNRKPNITTGDYLNQE